MTSTNKLIITFIIIISICSFIYFNYIKISYEPTTYEQELIEYFKEVALKSEFDENINKVIKWRKPMTIYVIKDNNNDYEEQSIFIKNSIKKINALVGEEFQINLTNDFKESNTYLFLGNKEQIKKTYSKFYEELIRIETEIGEVSGFCFSEFYIPSYNIFRSSIYINMEEPLSIQESTILEEITQSTGLPFDPEYYEESIFYEHKSEEIKCLELWPIWKGKKMSIQTILPKRFITEVWIGKVGWVSRSLFTFENKLRQKEP